ncbi:MAG: hypothetical protein R2794_11620 [Chitinophagales bacterium]
MRLFTCTLLCILSTGSLLAQTAGRTGNGNATFLGINFDLGIPINEFKTHNDEAAVGGGFDLFFQPTVKIPILIGFDFAFMNNGYKMQRETLTADIVAGGVVIDHLYFPLRVETYNNISTGHLNLRFLSPTKFFRPYVDGLVGFNNFNTRTSIYDESEEYLLSEADNPLITTSKQNSDWTFSYGAAAGMLVELNPNILINLRVAYTMGGTAQYFVESDIEDWEIEFNTVPTGQDDITDDDIAISAYPKKSATDMVLGTVGLTFKF